MLHFPFWLLLLLFISVETQLTINDNEGLIDTLLTAMRLYIEDATEKQSLSQECRHVIDTSFLKNTKYAIYNLNKLVKDSSINQNNLKELGIIKAISISEGYDVNYSMTHARELYKNHLIKIIKDLK